MDNTSFNSIFRIPTYVSRYPAQQLAALKGGKGKERKGKERVRVGQGMGYPEIESTTQYTFWGTRPVSECVRACVRACRAQVRFTCNPFSHFHLDPFPFSSRSWSSEPFSLVVIDIWLYLRYKKSFSISSPESISYQNRVQCEYRTRSNAVENCSRFGYNSSNHVGHVIRVDHSIRQNGRLKTIAPYNKSTLFEKQIPFLFSFFLMSKFLFVKIFWKIFKFPVLLCSPLYTHNCMYLSTPLL